MEVKKISKEDFNKSNRGGAKTCLSKEFETDLIATLKENKGGLFELPLNKTLIGKTKGVLNYIGTSKNKAKSFNVRARTLVQNAFNLTNDLGRVSVNKKADVIQFDLTNINKKADVIQFDLTNIA